MGEASMQNFIRSWNALVEQRVGYECQDNLQLVKISPKSEAEVPLLEEGSMGRALFLTIVPWQVSLKIWIEDLGRFNGFCLSKQSGKLFLPCSLQLFERGLL